MDGEGEEVRASLQAAMGTGTGAADRLCLACVRLLEVDGAAISLMYEGSTVGTWGSSSELSRRIDEYQFTFGEGPCLDASSTRLPVLVADLARLGEHRWPAFRPAVLAAGVRGVFAVPATVADRSIGVLDLYCVAPGPLSASTLGGCLVAAELAVGPLLDIVVADAATSDDEPHAADLQRIQVYQATGMVMGQLGVSSAEALVRLRAHAFATGRTASEVATAIVDGRLVLEADDGPGSGEGGPS